MKIVGFQAFLDKYGVTGVDAGFINKMDLSVGPILITAWTAGTPVTGLLGSALAAPPGGNVIMPFLEADLTPSLVLLAAGLPPPGVPAAMLPISPIALLGLVALNPLAPDKAKALANAMLDWAVSQAPPVPVPPGRAAPWPPLFIAV